MSLKEDFEDINVLWFSTYKPMYAITHFRMIKGQITEAKEHVELCNDENEDLQHIPHDHNLATLLTDAELA